MRLGAGFLLLACSSDPTVARTTERPDTSADRFFPQSIASGDPRPGSVILWTRLEPEEGAASTLRLVVGHDAELDAVVYEREFSVSAEHDGCLKTRVDGLEPDTDYYYAFWVETGGGAVRTRVGRTRTAPAAEQDRPVRFAFLSCQDYVGRYYDTLAHFLDQTAGSDDLDFIVHLGDYVYETTGDPGYQSTGTSRTFAFDDAAGAIDLGGGVFQAASSLDNYRQLYRTYRADPVLKRLHERYPLIATWDDHEFADDSWQAHATYFDGRLDEQSVERRHHAEQAYLEYLPTELALDSEGHGPVIAESDLYPALELYRSFRFGATLELFMTDSRSFRPDHLVAEDAFPAAILLDQTAAQTYLGEGIEPYVDIAAEPGLRDRLLPLVEQAYVDAGLDGAAAADRAAGAVIGLLSAVSIGDWLAAAGLDPPWGDLEALPRGLAVRNLGKEDLFSSFGSRYLVARDRYRAYAQYLADQRGGASDVLGSAQREWLLESVASSAARWKVVASSTSLVPMAIDFGNPLLQGLLPDTLAEALRGPVQLNADQWDGFPLGKAEILAALTQTPGVAIISGDIHASFVARHGLGNPPPDAHPPLEFTGPAVSSSTIVAVLGRQGEALGLSDGAAAGALVGPLIRAAAAADDTGAGAEIDFADLERNGQVALGFSSDEVEVAYWLYPAELSDESLYDDTSRVEEVAEIARFVYPRP